MPPNGCLALDTSSHLPTMQPGESGESGGEACYDDLQSEVSSAKYSEPSHHSDNFCDDGPDIPTEQESTDCGVENSTVQHTFEVDHSSENLGYQNNVEEKCIPAASESLYAVEPFANAKKRTYTEVESSDNSSALHVPYTKSTVPQLCRLTKLQFDYHHELTTQIRQVLADHFSCFHAELTYPSLFFQKYSESFETAIGHIESQSIRSRDRCEAFENEIQESSGTAWTTQYSLISDCMLGSYEVSVIRHELSEYQKDISETFRQVDSDVVGIKNDIDAMEAIVVKHIFMNLLNTCR
eukprot:Filipodium_phascolosomae@DN1642_c0_g1_i1.p1